MAKHISKYFVKFKHERKSVKDCLPVSLTTDKEWDEEFFTVPLKDYMENSRGRIMKPTHVADGKVHFKSQDDILNRLIMNFEDVVTDKEIEDLLSGKILIPCFIDKKIEELDDAEDTLSEAECRKLGLIYDFKI